MFYLSHLLPDTHRTKPPLGYKVLAPRVFRLLIFAPLAGQLPRREKNRPGWFALVLGSRLRIHQSRSNQEAIIVTIDEFNAPKQSIPCHHAFPQFWTSSSRSTTV